MQLRHDMIECFVVRPAGGGFEVLQLRRAASDYMGGLWHTVAGRMRRDETAVAACLRELREETGLTAAELYCLDRVGQFYMPAADTLWHCVLFVAVVDGGAQVVVNDEHDAFRWLAAEGAAKHFTWPSDREALAQVQEQILSDGPAKPYMRVKLDP
jgi:dATP pyrophosphohydrolase